MWILWWKYRRRLKGINMEKFIISLAILLGLLMIVGLSNLECGKHGEHMKHNHEVTEIP